MNRATIVLLAVGCALCASCARKDQWMTLKEGQTWTYRVRTPHYEYLEEIKVKGRVAVGSTSGYVLTSQLGQTHVAWSQGALWTTRIGHTIFVKPAPLFDGEAPKRTWKGAISIAGRTAKAEGVLECANEEIRVSGLNVKSRRATLTVQSSGSTIECTTWMAPGFGILKQEQRTNGMLDVSLERVRGS